MARHILHRCILGSKSMTFSKIPGGSCESRKICSRLPSRPRGRAERNSRVRQRTLLDQLDTCGAGAPAREDTAMATETQTSRIVTKVQPSVARISLHNAPLNVIDLQMMDELAQAVSEIEGRSEISAILISGYGGSFSAGVDVAAHPP